MAAEVHTVAVIGAGKIGELLLSGLLRSGWPADRLLATARRPARAEELAARYGIRVVDNLTAVDEADVLAIVGQAAGRRRAAGRDRPEGAGRQAGHLALRRPAHRFFSRRLPEGTPVVRVMTNTPALVDEAMTRDLGRRARHRRAPGPGRGDVPAARPRRSGCPSRSRTR